MDLGFPIGLVEEIGEFIVSEEVQLNPGDVVVLYTDGIPEAFDIIAILAGVVNFLPHASPPLTQGRE
jgi:serine phosphatase RsbU (regulator of sigma subunit)